MFKKNVSVVMGSATGIGKEVVKKLLAQDKTVAAMDIDAEGLNKLRAEHASNKSLLTFVVDTTKTESIISAINEIEKENLRIEEWVQSAGVARIETFAKMSDADFQLVQDVNFHGLVKANRVVLAKMEQQGFGTILNIGSVSGHVPAPLMTAYTASKHAVTGFTKALQEELAVTISPVKLILVSPGFVETPLLTKNLKIAFPDFLKRTLETPESVAEVIVTALKECPLEVVPTLNGKLMLAAEKLPLGTPFRFLKKKVAQRMFGFLLATLIVLSAPKSNGQEETGELYQEKKSSEHKIEITKNERKEEDPPVLERYQPLIFAVGRPRTKVQFSAKARILKQYPLYVGYTQTMFWELWEKSKPFYDTTYNPDIFYRWMIGDQKDIELDFGIIEHLSNGQGEENTRSANRTYVRASKEWKFGDHAFRGTAKFGPSYDYDDPNRDFADYVSPWEFQGLFTLTFAPPKDVVSLGFRVSPGGKYGHEWNRGGYLIFTSFRLDSIGLVPEIYAEYVDTYAESLRNYNEREKTFRLGFRF